MAQFYAYIRVSTLKQGEKGVSLHEQHGAIALYAERHGLQISEWFEERLTAAKRGRPLFAKMLKGLRDGRADGVIIHKIDRSARNLRDWADLGELIDAGIAVHFANEALDLLSRGGRLSADIQAVIASDFIRNLREETRKGIYGRLKQGFYPFMAPLGYLNTGSGRVKNIDPVRGPLVQKAFELYATGRHTLDSLLAEVHRLGLRNRNAGPVSRNGLSLILNNSFYAGVIHIKTTDETYAGSHAPLISMALFKQVRARLSGKIRTLKWTHDFIFRGLFHCSLCKRHLIGERQKGHVYYRCHTADCPTRGFREERLEAAVLSSWAPFALSDAWRQRLLDHLEYVAHQDVQDDSDRKAQIQAQIGGLKTRMTRLVDALLDGVLDKQSFEHRKRSLLEEQRSLEDSLQSNGLDSERIKTVIVEQLELACTAQQSYGLGNAASRRELVIRLCSNLTVTGKDVSIEPSFPFRTIEPRDPIPGGALQRYTTRTLKQTVRTLWAWAKAELEKEDQKAAA